MSKAHWLYPAVYVGLLYAGVRVQQILNAKNPILSRFEENDIVGITIKPQQENITSVKHANIECMSNLLKYKKLVELKQEVIFEKPKGADFKTDCRICNTSTIFEKNDGTLVTMNWTI